MLRGNHPATVDSKGRVKVPAAFLEALREHGERFYVTSENGDFVRVYPMKVWNGIEERLAQLSTHHRAKQKFLARTSYYGQEVTLDKQGRLLIPPLLRESAGMKGEVVVMGALTYMQIWNHSRFQDTLRTNPWSEDDEQILDELGI